MWGGGDSYVKVVEMLVGKYELTTFKGDQSVRGSNLIGTLKDTDRRKEI